MGAGEEGEARQGQEGQEARCQEGRQEARCQEARCQEACRQEARCQEARCQEGCPQEEVNFFSLDHLVVTAQNNRPFLRPPTQLGEITSTKDIKRCKYAY